MPGTAATGLAPVGGACVVRFRWLGTAGFEFASGDSHLLVDPYLTRNPRSFPVQQLKPPDLAGAKAVLLTHGHFDHVYDVPSIARLSGCQVYASSLTCERLAGRGVPPGQLNVVKGLDRFEVGPFRIEAVPSRHITFDLPLVARTSLRVVPHLFELAGKGTAFYPAGEVFGYLIEVEGKSMYHIGSAWLNEDHLRQYHVDIFFIPVQGHTGITKISAGMARKLMPHMVVPHHYDDFFPPLSRQIDLEPFKRALFEAVPHVRLIVPSLNQWIEV